MDKAFLWILYGCGLRREEALALTVFDIDLKRSYLTVKRLFALMAIILKAKAQRARMGLDTSLCLAFWRSILPVTSGHFPDPICSIRPEGSP